MTNIEINITYFHPKTHCKEVTEIRTGIPRSHIPNVTGISSAVRVCCSCNIIPSDMTMIPVI